MSLMLKRFICCGAGAFLFGPLDASRWSRFDTEEACKLCLANDVPSLLIYGELKFVSFESVEGFETDYFALLIKWEFVELSLEI